MHIIFQKGIDIFEIDIKTSCFLGRGAVSPNSIWPKSRLGELVDLGAVFWSIGFNTQKNCPKNS